jgi:hypothetical protein
VRIMDAEAFSSTVSEMAATSHGVVRIVGAEAFTMTVPKTMRQSCTAHNLYGDTSPYSLELPVVSLMSSDKWPWASLSLAMRAA